ncbi:Acg family FMN-binding oxidoreductase [Mycolicibacterium porcinum]|uniref:Acg family FMN-binding oxidoreductase n=1 Tax=Mycolicibacterium porcinum TaxID=39693 RepID=UPI00080B9D8D|nr:nitroreductase family protein [Mycolicibacterium porcinum]MBX8690328.1 NAD(P)H nitroreductase [Mycobacterium sp. 20091114027_K0903767]OCB49792.1 NAD(P)H nitroreductase [Mycolicibacterium vulneris]TVX97506.1 NAD(P)H nitroreductase [Mycolicibacterium porcinum]
MNAHFPDVATIRSALSLAVRAPSVHNTQPWLWRIGERSLHLYANTAVHLPRTDPDSRDLILSCGAVLNHCVVALAALGWGSKVHRFPNPEDAGHVASIELHRYKPAEADISLAAAIPRRRTDRRHFSSWPVAHGDIALMGARAARAGVTMRRLSELDGLCRLVAQAAWQHVNDAEYRSEQMLWSGHHAETTGVPARSAPEPNPADPLPARHFAGPALLQETDASIDEDSAVVLALGTAEDDQVSRLRAGEATSLILLTATALGLASCPITEPLEVAETRSALRRDIFGGDGYPQMLLRIGWAPLNADPLPPTPRKAIAEVATRLDGSPLH